MGMMTRRWLKFQAKATLGRNPKPFWVIGGTLLGLMTLIFLVQTYVGGLMVMMPLELAQYPMMTGVWQADPALMGGLLTLGGLGGLSTTGGLVISLRMETVGLAMVMMMPWSLLASFLCVQLIVLLVTSPFRLGALEQFWKMIGKEKDLDPTGPFRWYTDLRLTGKALVVELVLGVWQGLTQVAFLVPGMALMVLGYRGSGEPMLLTLSMVLTVLGPLAGYWLYCLILPARYVLAKDPGMSPFQALRQGAEVFRGRRKELYLFRLSFLPLNVLSKMLSDLPDAFVFPYEELSCMLLIDGVPGPEEAAQRV